VENYFNGHKLGIWLKSGLKYCIIPNNVLNYDIILQGNTIMLGSQDEQLTFADMDNWQERIPKNSFYYRLRKWVENNLNYEQFAHFCSKGKGRPSLSPTRMLTAIII